jgi:hypothetical protein
MLSRPGQVRRLPAMLNHQTMAGALVQNKNQKDGKKYLLLT